MSDNVILGKNRDACMAKILSKKKKEIFTKSKKCKYILTFFKCANVVQLK